MNHVLTFFFGLLGSLGHGLMPVQLVFAVGGLALALKYLRKARAASVEKKQSAP